jgi:uncharacterized protein YbjT (DUF2867 family)
MRVIITGATGMVGEGVLNECLHHDLVKEVLIINRKPSGIMHPKLKEIIHNDFFDFLPIEKDLMNYDACFFCLGVSSIGLKEAEYFKLSHTLTLHVASILVRNNPSMVFCYVSGTGTDSTEKGRVMWARVKGKTENDLTKLPFRNVYNLRPGIIQPTKGLKNTLSIYKYFSWLLKLIRAFSPGSICTLREIGLAMIKCVSIGYKKQVLEIKDIKILANS